jgi:hypothetical protein
MPYQKSQAQPRNPTEMMKSMKVDSTLVLSLREVMKAVVLSCNLMVLL